MLTLGLSQVEVTLYSAYISFPHIISYGKWNFRLS